MKHSYFSLIIIFFVSTTSYSQVDVTSLGFNFSSLVRDTAGRVQPSKPVTLRFSLLLGQNGTTTNSPYIETQNTSTDAYGFVNVTIGTGTKIKGSSFAKVDFGLANYWILIEVLNNFTKAYEPLAKQALQAVPYAKVAGVLKGSSAIPAGTIVAFAGDTSHIPAGWLLCDGRELLNTDSRYQSLFNAIQYNWGTSNHADLFNVPYTQGEFLRGANNGASSSRNDPEAGTRIPVQLGANAGDNVGSYESDMFASHAHSFVTNNAPALNFSIGSQPPRTQDTGGINGVTNATGGAETRPKNVYVNYIIKL